MSAHVSSSMCKIFMIVLTSRLTEWSEEHTAIGESQVGLRKVPLIICLTSGISAKISASTKRTILLHIYLLKKI